MFVCACEFELGNSDQDGLSVQMCFRMQPWDDCSAEATLLHWRYTISANMGALTGSPRVGSPESASGELLVCWPSLPGTRVVLGGRKEGRKVELGRGRTVRLHPRLCSWALRCPAVPAI